MISFDWYSFSELTLEQLYKILSLRAQVFVVEQHCPYLDPDGKDETALHLLGIDNDELVAYLRFFPPTSSENAVIFGRIVTHSSVRTKGYGKKLMQEMLKYSEQHYPASSIKCSAQYYLKKFYESFGFVTIGDVYQEDDLPHIAMIKTIAS